jgi:hypothetical protein
MSDIFETGYDSSLSRSSLNLDDGSSLIGEKGKYTGALGSTVEGELEATNLGSGAMASVLFTGKDTFTSTTAGYRMGIDFSTDTYKWIIGDSANHIDWNVTTANTLTITGALSASTITGGTIQTSSSGARVVITDTAIGSLVQANSLVLYDRDGHVMFGVGTTNTTYGDRAVLWLDLDSSYAGGQQKGLYISRNLVCEATEHLVNIIEDSTSSAANVFNLQNDGGGIAFVLTNTGDGRGLLVTSSGAGEGILIDKSGSNHGLEITSNSSDPAYFISYSGTAYGARISSSNSGVVEADAALRIDKTASGNFQPLISLGNGTNTFTIWIALNSANANGNLTANTGDVCFGAGNLQTCISGTTWQTFDST